MNGSSVGARVISAAVVSLVLVAGVNSQPPGGQLTGVNHRYPDGSTPLQWAVYDGEVAEVRRLLEAGADVTLANDYGATAMSLAAEVSRMPRSSSCCSQPVPTSIRPIRKGRRL